MKRRALVLALLLLAATGCADDTTTPPDQTAQQKEARGEDDSSSKEKERAKGGESSEEHSAGTQQKSTRSEDRGGGDASAGASDEGNSSKGASTSQAASYPAAGAYTFSQSGYEEFCDSAGQCEREDLPARQPTRVSYERRSEDSALVVAEQEASDSRLARTWTRFTPSGAHITKLYFRFEYSGFRFERTIVPEPPVEALRFPMEQGQRWSGRWKASTSGSYTVHVGAPDQLEISGKTVTAYPIDTTTEFHGELDGKSRITAYIDVESRAIVATKGVLNSTSQFGRYTTSFETMLKSGPGY